MTGSFTCESCGAPARLVVDGHPLCDRCGDTSIAAATGWPALPEPALPETLRGADGRAHRIAYRLIRMPGGISAIAEEEGVSFDEGYGLTVHGPHTADAKALETALREQVRTALAQRFLDVDNAGSLQLAGDAVRGRVTEDPTDVMGLPHVVVDGRPLSWEEFGGLIRPYVGWHFQLHFGEQEDADGTSANAAPAGVSMDDDGDFGLDDDTVIEAWEQNERAALRVLQHSLPESLPRQPPRRELTIACEQLRDGFRRNEWTWAVIRRANGWRRLQDIPSDDEDLWLQSAASMISLSESSGLPLEEEAAVATLEAGDWLGAVLQLVRAGVGGSADSGDLARGVVECPEVVWDTTDADNDDGGLAFAFEVVLPTWEVVSAVDDRRRLTALGMWGLPRALALAWGGSLDAELIVEHRIVTDAPPGTRYLLTEHYQRAP